MPTCPHATNPISDRFYFGSEYDYISMIKIDQTKFALAKLYPQAKDFPVSFFQVHHANFE